VAVAVDPAVALSVTATDETRLGPDVLVRPGAAVDQRVLEADLLVAPNERP
jgi:hypothetical protein